MKNKKEADPNRERSTISRRDFLNVTAVGSGLVFLGATDGWLTAAFAATPPAQPVGQIVAGLTQEPTVFMPLFPHADVDRAVHHNLFSPLWNIDEKGIFQPDLVTEIPSLENGGISQDGLDWRIRLKPEVKWHDGVAFTAEDVKFTFELIQDPDFPATLFGGSRLVDNVNIVSPNELTFSLTKPYGPFKSILAWMFVVPRHLIEQEANRSKPIKFLENPIGTGPFKWAERAAGDHITLAANSNYHGDGPYAAKLVFKYVPDLTVLYTQFQTGEVDYVGMQGISPDKYEEARKLPKRVVSASPQPMIESVLFNVGKEVLKDQAVREALYLAMDKQGLIEQIYYGLPRETESFLPYGSWAYNSDLPRHEYNVERANQILDEAQWIRGADGVREKDGVRLEFTNSTTAGNHAREQAQQLLQQNWRDIGVKMTISNFPAAVIWADYWNLSQFDSVMVGINFMVAGDPDATSWFTSTAIPVRGGKGNNTSQYANPDVDRLFSEGASTFDHDERIAAYLQVQEIIRRELPCLPLFQYNMVQGVKEGLNGFTPNVNVRENSWNARTWYWEN